MKRITLCADDFALSPVGSRRIIELINRQRLSATSVMSQSPHWPLLADELREVQTQADIGLHFNLTHPFTERSAPLLHWLVRSQARLLDKAWLTQYVLEQIDRFTEHFQRLPDFIDGHQHVHAFPVIREALFEAIAQRWSGAEKPYLRAPDALSSPGDSHLKALVLKASCAGFNTQATALGYAAPHWFAGLYSLTPQAGFAELMQQWFAHAPTQSLIMCHPGSNASDDAIGPAREVEYAYLASDAFYALREQQHVMISRFQP